MRSTGVGEPIGLPLPIMRAGQFDVAPGGRRIAITVSVVSAQELLVADMVTGNVFRAFGPRNTIFEPRWSPDGSRIAINADARSLIVTPDRSGAPLAVGGHDFLPSHWYAADRLLGYARLDARIVDVAVGATPRVDTLRSSEQRQRAHRSPDGRLMAYMSDDLVAVERFPQAANRTIIGRGLDPLWLDARTLMYRDGTTWYRARFSAEGTLAAPPARWFSDPRFIDTSVRSHALTPTGEVVYLRSSANATASYIRLIPGWAESVRRAVAATARRRRQTLPLRMTAPTCHRQPVDLGWPGIVYELLHDLGRVGIPRGARG